MNKGVGGDGFDWSTLDIFVTVAKALTQVGGLTVGIMAHQGRTEETGNTMSLKCY